MDFDYDDPYELESDIYSKKYKTPQQIMEHQLWVVHKGDYKSYLNSIQWDTPPPPETEEEKQLRIELEEEKRIQREMETHPFRKWF